MGLLTLGFAPGVHAQTQAVTVTPPIMYEGGDGIRGSQAFTLMHSSILPGVTGQTLIHLNTGTAHYTNDYVGNIGTRTMGQVTFNLNAVEDYIPEGDETINLEIHLSNGSNPSTVFSTTITLRDGPPPHVIFSRRDFSVTEANSVNGSFGYEVKLSEDPGAQVTVTATSSDSSKVTVQSGSGSAGGSTVLTFNSMNWQTAQTITARAVGDSDTNDESVSIEHTVSKPASGPFSVGEVVRFRDQKTDDPQMPDGRVAVTVRDNTKADFVGITVTPRNISLTEGGPSKTYTVKPNMNPGGALTVYVRPEGQDAGKISVVTASGQPILAFDSTNWQTVQTVTIQAVDDIDAANHRIVIDNFWWLPDANTGASNKDLVVTVMDDEMGTSPGISLDTTSISVQEDHFNNFNQISDNAHNARTKRVHFRLDTDPGRIVTVTITSSDPAIEVSTLRGDNIDHFVIGPTGWSGGSEGGPWDNGPRQVNLTATSDADGDSETATVTFSAPDYQGQSATLTAQAEDDDAVSLAASLTSLTEGQGSTINAHVGNYTGSALSIPLQIRATGTTATSGTDFSLTNTPISVPDGTSQGSIPANVLTELDSTDEPDETIIIELGGALPSGKVAGSPSHVEITLVDRDPTTVTMAAASAAIDESGDSNKTDVTITLGRDLVAGESITVPLDVTGAIVATHYTFALKGNGGTGVSFDDTTPHSTQNPAVIFANAGARTATLELVAVDNSDTTARTVEISYGEDSRAPSTALGGGLTLSGSGQTVTINDNDGVTNLPVVSIAEGSAVTEGTAAGFTINANPAPAANLAVTVTVADDASSDFLAAATQGSKTVTISSGSTTYSVATVNDTGAGADEPDGEVTVTVEGGTGYTVGTASSAATKVNDDDATTVTLAGAAGNVTEGGTKALTLTLGRGLISGEELTVPLTFGSGTATRGTDYTLACPNSLPTGVTCPNNLGGNNPQVVFTGPSSGVTATSVTITFSAASDNMAESSAETVTIGLGTLTHTGLGGGATGTNNLAGFAIEDPAAGAVSVALAAAATSIDESGPDNKTDVTITLGRTLAAGETATVPLTVTGPTVTNHYTLGLKSGSSLNTGVSLNTSGSHSAQNPAVVMTAGARVATLELAAVNNDGAAERTVSIAYGTGARAPTLTPSGDLTLSGSPQSVAIENDDPVGVTVTESAGTTVVSEPSGTDTYTLTMTSHPSADVTIAIAAGAGVQVNKQGQGSPGASLTLTFLTANWSDVRTVQVTAVDDSNDNPGAGRTASITHMPTSTDSDYDDDNLTIASVSATITDNDPTAVTLSGGTDDVSEGRSKSLTLTLGRGLVAGETLTVPLTFGGVAQRNTDYRLAGTNARGVAYRNLNTGNAAVVFTGPNSGATATSVTITLTAVSDGTAEGLETVVIGLGTLSSTGLDGDATGADDLADFSIRDPITEAEFASASQQVREDAGTRNVALRLSPPSAAALTVNYIISGTATQGNSNDFTVAGTTTTSGSVQVPAGTTTATIAVMIHDDTEMEGNETVILTLDAGTGYEVDSAKNTHTLTIRSSDNPPTASNGTVTARPRQDYVFQLQDFGYRDPDGDPLNHVKIETLPSPGMLKLDGANVAVDAQILRAEIAAGDLRFTPADEPLKRSPYASFTFKVNDGSADSASSYTLTINVANQPPVAKDGEVKLNSGKPHTFEVEDFEDLYSDADGDPFDGIMITAPPEKGMLTLDGTVVTPDTSVSRAQLEEKRKEKALVFTPEAGEGGSPYTSFGFQVYDGFEYSAPARMVLHVESLAAGRMMQQWLARFGRTVADQVIGAVEDRLRNPQIPAEGSSLQLSLAGRSLDSLRPLDDQVLDADPNSDASDPAEGPTAHRETRDERDLRTDPLTSGEDIQISQRETPSSGFLGSLDWLGGSSFHYARGNRNSGLKSVWGRGAISQFDGRDGSARVDGRVESLMLGADFMQDGRALGILLSHSRGKGDYQAESGGSFESNLTGVYPYARHEIHERLSLWGVAGYGEGDVELHRATGTLETDVDLWMVAGGLRGQVQAGGEIWPELSAVADVLWVETGSDALEEALPAVDAEVSRIRVGLEGTWAALPVGHGQLSPRLRISLRHDGGDAEEGFGTEVRAGADWRDARHGLRVQLQGHALLTHEEDGAQEKGFSGSLAWDPRPGSLRGVEFSLAASAGQPAGSEGFLTAETFEDRPDRESVTQWRATLGYGTGAFGDRFTAVPQLGVAWSADAWDVGLGWRLVAEQFDLLLKAGHRNPRGEDPENQIRVQLQGRW